MRRIPFYGRIEKFEIDKIKDFKVQSGVMSYLRFNNSPATLFSDPKRGSVRFKYGLKSCGFALEVQKDDAEEIMKFIQERIEKYASNK